MRETETISQPYEALVTRQDGELVEVTIRAVGDGVALDYDTFSAAVRAIQERLRRDESHAKMQSRRADSVVLRGLREAYGDGHGRMTPEYLANLARAYADGSKGSKSVVPLLAAAIDKPSATVKGHVVKARQEGYLSEAEAGRSGGELTDKAREVLGMLRKA